MRDRGESGSEKQVKMEDEACLAEIPKSTVVKKKCIFAAANLRFVELVYGVKS